MNLGWSLAPQSVSVEASCGWKPEQDPALKPFKESLLTKVD